MALLRPRAPPARRRPPRAPRAPPVPLLLLLAAAAAVLPARGLDNGVLLPHMGWSTWNTLRGKFNESVLREVADAMVASGLAAAGYTLLNIDDGWPLPKRAADGSIVVNPALFPSGMPALAAFLAARAPPMALGIYTGHCSLTCQGFPGSLGHEAQDARTYASWPATFVKSDNCPGGSAGGCNDTQAFSAMRDALNATGRRFAYNVHWGNSVYPLRRIAGICNSWRVAIDMKPSWADVLRLIDVAAPLGGYAGPGAALDLDMLEVGNGMLESEDRAHFSMWAMFASPLVAGNDPRTQSAATIAILTNALVIRVDQDPLVVPARIVAQAGNCKPGENPAPVCSWQAFARPLADGSTALALLNRGGNATASGGGDAPSPPANISVSFFLLDDVGAGPYEAIDLWAGGASRGEWRGAFWALVPPHDVVMVRLVPKG